MNQLFSPNCLNYIESVYSLAIPTPSPPLSYSFTNLIPSINFSKLKIKKLLQTEDKIIPELHLTFLERFPALSMINENKYSIKSSDSGKTFTSIFILQSICPPFLEYGEYFDTEVLRLLIDLLKFSRKLEPQLSNLCNQSFTFLYEKCIKHLRFTSLLSNITRYFQRADEYPTEWFSLHILCIKALLTEIISNPTSQLLLLSSSLITTIAPRFACLETKLTEEPEILNKLYELIFLLYQNFPEDHPSLAQDQNYLDLKQGLIKIGLELNRITDVPFKQYLTIVMQSIQGPLFLDEELNLKIEPISAEKKTLEFIENISLAHLEKHQNSNDPEQILKLGSFSVPKCDSIYEMLSSINHPILKYHEYLFSCLSNLALVSLIKLIISEGQNFILNGDLLLQTFLFFELSNLKDLTEISTFVKQKNKKSIFFTENLFNPAVTIFNHPESKIHSIRSAVYNVFNSMTDESTSCFFIPILTDYLNKFVPYPEIFSEFIYFNATSLCEINHSPSSQTVILDCFSHAIQYQSEAKFNNYAFNCEFRTITFTMLDKFIESVKNRKPEYFFVSTFLSEIIYMIFDDTVSEIIFNLIEKYLLVFLETHDQMKVDKLIAETFTALDFCLDHINLCGKQITRLLTILFEFLSKLQSNLIEVVQKTQFFDKIRSFINSKEIEVDSLAYALIIEHLIPDHRSEHEWKKLAEIIENIEMTESIYYAILILLSYNNEPFTNIGNQNAVVLIPAILKSKFCLNFLQKVNEVLKNSIPDQILFSELGIAQKIINILTEDTSDEIWKSALDALRLTFAYSTTRNDLLTFFRLFSPIDDHTQTKHMQELLHIIPILVAQEQTAAYRSIIRFTTRSGLIRAPLIPMKKLPYGFTISYRIMLCNFQKQGDSFRLFKFFNGETTSYLKSMIYQRKIVISSNLYSKEISFDLNFPLNRWFVLSISFGSHPDDIAVFVNKRNAPSVNNSTSGIDWPELFNKNNHLFGGEGQGFVECHFKKAAIFANSAPFTFPDLINDENIKLNPSTFFLIDSEMAGKGQIQNLAQKSVNNYELVGGQLFTSISPFISTFYYTNGVSFIVSLFSQIDYDIPSLNNDTNNTEQQHQQPPYTNTMYFYQLFELVNVLIQMSDFAQQKLYNISAFEVIAHFMNNSNKITMNFDVSSRILAIQPTIRNDQLRSSFVRSILLNFPLWTTAPVITLKELFKAWRYSTKLIPDALSKELRPPVILNVLMKLYETNGVNDEIREILFEILIKALSIDCRSSDLAMIITVMHINQNNPTEIINYLQMLNQLVIKCPTKIGPVSHALATTEWITLYPDQNVKSILINYFMRKDLNILIQFVLKNIEDASHHNESENDSLLLECCCTFAGVKYDSIKSIIQNFSSTSLNYLNMSIFPIIIGYSLYSSDNACEQLSEFLLCVFGRKEGVDLIKVDKSKFSLFLLVSFLLIKSKNRIDFMVKLCSSDPSIFSNTLKMIDLFMHITLIEYHQFQTNLSLKIIQSILSPSFNRIINKYINILINFICFHTPRAKRITEKQFGELTFHTFLKACKKKVITLPQYSFYMNKIKDKWADFSLAVHLLESFPSDKKIEADKILILLSFICHPYLFHKEKVLLLVNKFVSIIPSDSKSWYPVIYQASKHWKDFESASEFFNTFKQKLKSPTESYINFNDYFNKIFIPEAEIGPVFSSDNGNIFNAILQNLKFDSKENKSEAAIAEMRKNIKDIQYGFESCWNKLYLNLSYQLSPFYKSNKDNYYKRGNYFDFKLRPSILMRSIPKKGSDFVEDIIKFITKNKKIHNNYYDNIFKSQKGETELYRCQCVQVRINKIICGTFFFTNTGFRFVTTSFKVKSINASSITHFFWAATPLESCQSTVKNSIQIFLKNKRCYLFTFPHDNVTTLISKGYINRGIMNSIQFFQENEPDLELDRLQLTRKWETSEISNFDYILWLNILSGRSFLNKNAYPVFPNVFENNEENRQIINYSNLSNQNIDVAQSSNHMIGHCLGSYEPFKSTIDTKDYNYLNFEIPPELYINEFFVSEKDGNSQQTINVPKWAKTKVDFLFEMMKALESDGISNQINLWIDKVFGQNTKYNKENSCLPVSLFNNQHPQRKLFNKGQVKANHITLTGLSNLHILDFNIVGQSINSASIFGILSDGSIFKSSIDSHSSIEKLDTIVPNMVRVTSSSQYLFMSRGSVFAVFSYEKKKILQFSSDPIASRIVKLAICDDFIAAAGADGCVVVWSLNPDLQTTSPSVSPTTTVISSLAQSSKTTFSSNTTSNSNLISNLPNQLRRKRSSTARSFSSLKRAYSKDSLPALESGETSSSNQQAGSSHESDDESFTSIFDYNSEPKVSPLLAQSVESTSSQPPTSSSAMNRNSITTTLDSLIYLPCNVLLVHHFPVCSLQISTQFGIVVSADPSGLIAISLLPELELCRTIKIKGFILKSAIITEGYGSIVVLSKSHSSKGFYLSSYSLNGELMKQISLNNSVTIVDICGVVGTVSGFDYVFVADSNNDISIYDAYSLEIVEKIYHFNEPIKKIKFSQNLSLLMVFFESHQDKTPNPPAIISYIMH